MTKSAAGESFRALLVAKNEQGQPQPDFVILHEDDLMMGDVTIAVSHSSLNYKDALALTGKAPILRQLPLIPGIDLAGTVLRSETPEWQAGDQVVLNGWGIGESHYGGFAERARVKGDWLMPVPPAWQAADTMAIGVAGITAMMSVMALEEQGVTPEKGELLVTGATGGVGSIAILLLKAKGYQVAAATRRLSESDFLNSLGADSIIGPENFAGAPKPLARERWAGLIDTVGSTTLAHGLSQLRAEGVATACGLAQSMDLPTTVAPFILRGVRLIGINSVTVSKLKRQEIWRELVKDIDLKKLSQITSHQPWHKLPQLAEAMIQGQLRGRTVIDIV